MATHTKINVSIVITIHRCLRKWFVIHENSHQQKYFNLKGATVLLCLLSFLLSLNESAHFGSFLALLNDTMDLDRKPIHTGIS